MRVLRVEIEAPTTSFRYPHFMVGRHPTYPMPPPATVHGLVCAAVGELLGPEDFRFGYRFVVAGSAHDLEHLHFVSQASRSDRVEAYGDIHRGNTNATVIPTVRDFLFGARLTLYLDKPDLARAFREPRYALCLGRSQDLTSVVRVDDVELVPRPQGYFEHTLLPAEARLWANRGTVTTLPRYLDHTLGRRPAYAHYLFLTERLVATIEPAPELAASLGPQRVRPLPDAVSLWVDPDSPDYRGTQRAVWFHGFN